MSFMQAEDEDVDFLAVESGSSKLVNIFTEPHHDTSPSLKYTPPKQPRKVEGQVAGFSMAALFTSVVTSYKFDGSKYSLQGRVGAAILGNHNIRSYKLLLYKGKQQPVAIATIGPKFVFTVQPNRYATFSDDQQENWTILFDSDNTLEEFAKQIALAKANSLSPGGNMVISQPLTVGEGPGLELGDTAQILFTGYLLTNFSFGSTFETNQGGSKPFKIKLGKGKCMKGLEEGLVGAKKNSKVLLVIPPSLGFGSQGLPSKVPPDSTLLYEVEIIKVKSEKDSRSSTPTKHVESAPEALKTQERKPSFSSAEDSIRVRGASLTEHIAQPKTDKAQIISRMAKMGMSMLPGMPPAATSGEEEVTSAPQVESQTTAGGYDVIPSKEEPLQPRSRQNSQSPVPISPSKPKPRVSSATSPPQQQAENPPTISSSMAASQDTEASKNMTMSSAIPGPIAFDPRAFGYHPAYMATAGASFTTLPFPPAAASYTSMESHLPLLITETRTQNTEIRLLLNKLGDKMDILMNKVEANRNLSQKSISPDSSYLHNLDRIIDENSRLKHENNEKTMRISDLTERISELLSKSSRFLDEKSSQLIEPRGETFVSAAHPKIQALEEERKHIEKDLSEALSNLSSLKKELADSQNELMQTKNELQKLLEERSLSRQGHTNQINHLQQQLREAQKQTKELQQQVAILQESLDTAAHSKETLETTLKENRQRLIEERDKTKKEIDELVAHHKKEVEELRMKIRELESTPMSPGIAEEELRKEWQENLERIVAENKAIYQKQLDQLLENKVELNLRVMDLETQLTNAKVSSQAYIEQVTKDIESQWKAKYDLLQAENDLFKMESQGLIERLKSQMASLQDENAYNANLNVELKRLVNAVYRSLQNDIEPNGSYLGVDILQLVLETFRTITLQLLDSYQKNEEGSYKVVASPSESSKAPSVYEEDFKSQASNNNENNKVSEVTEDAPNSPTMTLKNEDTKESKPAEPLSPPLAQWKPQPPPPPLFDEEEEEEEEEVWLK